MVVEFSVVPLGEKEHFGAVVAEFVKIVEKSGIPFELTPMGTVMEGEWDDIMGVIKACHQKAHDHAARVLTSITIDDFAGRTGRLKGKIESVKRALR